MWGESPGPRWLGADLARAASRPLLRGRGGGFSGSSGAGGLGLGGGAVMGEPSRFMRAGANGSATGRLLMGTISLFGALTE